MEIPYHEFIKHYKNAEKSQQLNIEAACLSTISDTNKPSARFVNIKYINNREIIFFSNYKSHKADNINFNSNIALTLFWSSVNTQIRINGKVKKLSNERSNSHWEKRSKSKNALAISSAQSSKSISYQEVIDNYEFTLENDDLSSRPNYWGGYTIDPSYFEFWTGHKSRVNKRKIFEKKDIDWKKYFLNP